LGDRGRTAHAREQDVRGGIVAQRHHGLAEFGDRHLGADMLLGHRRVGQDVFRLDADAPRQLLLARVDPRQNRRGGQGLERAAHGKTFIQTMTGQCAAPGIEHGDAEPPATVGLDLGKARAERNKSALVCAGGIGGKRTSNQRRKREPGETTSCEHQSSC
jgi:hypothetical protein